MRSEVFSRRYAVRRVLLPILALALVFVPSYSWLRAGRVPGRYLKRCQTAIFERKEPAANLLLIGASRTGFAIDEAIVDLRLASDGSHRTEKMVLLGNAESDTNMGLRTYLRERGVPETLGIEVLITRVAGDSAPGRYGAALTGRSYALFGASAYSGYLGGLIDNGVVGRGDVYARSYFPSPLKFFFEHLQVGFDNAFRNLGKTIDPMNDCDRPVIPAWGPVAAAPYNEATPQPTAEKIARLTKDAGRYVPVNVDSRRASGEIAVMRDTVRIARAAGVKNVFFYYFPSFAETPDIIDLGRIEQLVPVDGVFDARPIISDPAKPGLDKQYKDRAHLTKYAAYEVTTGFVEFMKGLGK